MRKVNATIARQSGLLSLPGFWEEEETPERGQEEQPAPSVPAPSVPRTGFDASGLYDYGLPPLQMNLGKHGIVEAPQLVAPAKLDTALVDFALEARRRGQAGRCESADGRFDHAQTIGFKNEILGRPASDRPVGDLEEWGRAMGILEERYPLLPVPEPKKGRGKKAVPTVATASESSSPLPPPADDLPGPQARAAFIQAVCRHRYDDKIKTGGQIDPAKVRTAANVLLGRPARDIPEPSVTDWERAKDILVITSEVDPECRIAPLEALPGPEEDEGEKGP